ncbi:MULTISPECIES: RNA polymerase sigma factor [unclassified Flavobacterium]|uniref:RNA polymerase sigma factor n=1 Tax=unclassified Flavobacterium TaxID=196869 RepID=UPI0021112C1E|nr:MULTISPECIES: RNA polymerase sigma factor [unclassified Flavobacterium]
MDLDNIIKGCMDGDRKAREALYGRYRNTLFALSLKYCANLEEAEDNLHNAFVEIFTNIRSFANKGSFEGWMKRITIHKAIDSYRKTFGLVALPDKLPDDTTVDEDEMDVSLDRLLELVQRLPNQYRLVFCLYELDDYSHKEIASMLDITEGTSKSNLHKAKALLKRELQQTPINPKKVSNGK